MLGSKLWSCSDLQQGYEGLMQEDAGTEEAMRKRVHVGLHRGISYVSTHFQKGAKHHLQELRAQIADADAQKNASPGVSPPTKRVKGEPASCSKCYVPCKDLCDLLN